jgi:hypothetical protein
MSRLHEELQRKDREYNANIMELEAQLNWDTSLSLYHDLNLCC